MAFKVEFSEQAAIDLSEILDYMHNELYVPQAAERFYNAVLKQLGIIGDNPFIYPVYQDKNLNTQCLHFITIGNYLIFYAVNNSKSIVSIVRIVYGKRNISAILNE